MADRVRISDLQVLEGTEVFAGTRVPIDTFFDYIEDNFTLDEFLECFPTVTKEAALAVLNDGRRAGRAK